MGEEIRGEMKDREDAGRMKSCRRLDGTSEQHRGSQKHFTNTGNAGKGSQSSRSPSASMVGGATKCSDEFMGSLLM